MKIVIDKTDTRVVMAVEDDGVFRDSRKPKKFEVWERLTTLRDLNRPLEMKMGGVSKDRFESIEGAPDAPANWEDYKYDKGKQEYTKLTAGELHD